MQLCHVPFAVERLPAPSFRSSCASLLSPGSGQPHLPIPVSQLFNHQQLSPKTHHTMLCHVGDCAHHPSSFIVFTQLAQVCIFFIIILIFPILAVVRTCKIAGNISDGIQDLLTCCFRVSGCHTHRCSISNIFLLLLNRCLCVFNPLSCHSGLSIHTILDPFLCPFIAHTVHFFSFLHLEDSLYNCKLCNTLRARTHSPYKPLVPSFAWWRRRVECFLDSWYLPTGSGERFCFGALPIVLCVALVAGWDVGCCKIWTTWRQAACFMSRLVCLIDLSKARSAFWP